MEFYKEKLEKVLTEKKFTKSKLAKLIGVTQPAVGAWIRGQRVPRERNVAMMAKALDIPVDEISNLKKIADISEEVSGYFQGWGSSLNKNKTELDDPCIKAIKEIENIKSEQYRLRTVTRAFMSTMQSMLYVKSYYGKYIVANESYLKAIGLDVNINIIGKTDKDIMSMKNAASNDTQDMSIINTGKPLINKSIKFPFTNSKIKWCVMTKVPLRDNKQNIIGMVASFADITEEKKLRKQDEILNEAIKQCHVGISVISNISGKRKIEFINEASENIFGYDKEEIKKDPLCWYKNVKKSDRHKIDQYTSDIINPERRTSVCYTNPSTGREMYLWFESYKVKDSSLFYNCVYDATDYVKNEQEKEKLFTGFNLLIDFLDKTGSAVFVGEYSDTTLDLVSYVYRNKKAYNYIDENKKWEDILDPKQRNELLTSANVKKYPKIMKYNIIKNSEICTIEEKLWLKELNGNKYFFSVIRDIERQDNVEVAYPDSLEL